MDEREFCRRYPALFHAAGSDDALESILAKGLLPASGLLDLAGPRSGDRIGLEHRRPRPVELSVDGRCVVLRDQKPLSVSKLEKALLDMSVEEWLRLLNGRVFFWPSERRLRHFLDARSYRDQTHLVLEVDSGALLSSFGQQVFVTTMNTGATRPFAAPRGRATFRPVSQLDRKHARKVVEVTVVGGLPDVRPVLKRAFLIRRGVEIATVWAP